MRKKIRIGELLVKNGVITEEQLKIALTQQKKLGRKLGQTLVELSYVEEDELLNFLAEQMQLPFVDLTQIELDRLTVLKLPETHARRFRAIVLKDSGKDFLVGMADPMDIFALDELSRILKRTLRAAVVRESDLAQTIDRMYRRTDEISTLAVELDDELSTESFDSTQLDVADEATEAPVTRLLRSLFEDAVQVSASDIHIEPDQDVLRIRQRVDGVLQEHVMREKKIAAALVLRLKLMSGLDISEKRIPQDGRFQIQVKDRTIDIRLSTMPVQNGESVAMRLLDQSGTQLSLDEIGMPERILSRFRRLLRLPHGLVLVTGPTGSGKTTTLYGALRELNEPGKKIISVEDPVEYRLPRINQVQVNRKIPLDFATVLRAALRQDPDILMVGEMRDQETAEMGLRAAMTGHLVLSTVHTNDAINSALRLVDMGVEGYLAASALRGVIAQRLVRKICDRCRTQHEVEPREQAWLEATVGKKASGLSFQEGRGCTHCNGTGYRGRVGVYELLELDADMIDALRRNDPGDYERAARKSKGFRPLSFCALAYAGRGITSLDEVLRVSEAVEETPEAAAEPSSTEQNPPAAPPATR